MTYEAVSSEKVFHWAKFLNLKVTHKTKTKQKKFQKHHYVSELNHRWKTRTIKVHVLKQDWLEWPFSELCSANILLWNQYKYSAFNIFSCRILIISYKILIITGRSNEKTNELTIYGILNVTIFYRQELVSLFQVQEKLKTRRSWKLNFSSSCLLQMTVI